jgi:hypothetical protein
MVIKGREMMCTGADLACPLKSKNCIDSTVKALETGASTIMTLAPIRGQRATPALQRQNERV